MSRHVNASTQVPGQAYFLDLLGDAYNGLGRYDEAIAALSEAAEAFRDLARGVGRCLNDGRDVFEVATMVWTSLHGFAALRAIRHSPFPSAGRYVAVLLDAYLDPD